MKYFVFTPFQVRMYAHPSFLHSRDCLIGRHDRTAIIVAAWIKEETSVWEIVSHGEAQQATAQTS